jgi:Zn-dependent M28 family amino/carboxypeptidase
LIKKLGLQPRRTIRVVFWVNEENGGRGGEAYRTWVGDAIKNHVAAIEMDGGAEAPQGFGYGAGGFAGGGGRGRGGRGRGAAASVPNQAEENSMAMLKQVGGLLNRINAGEIAAGGGGSDIGPLMRDGVPGLSERSIGTHYFDWHHTETDTLDKVNPEDFRKSIAALAVMSYVLADMPEKLAGSGGQ